VREVFDKGLIPGGYAMDLLNFVIFWYFLSGFVVQSFALLYYRKFRDNWLVLELNFIMTETKQSVPDQDLSHTSANHLPEQDLSLFTEEPTIDLPV